jgi:MoaA/NifB/PqqE/SkfB family radical SAM enzyme
MKWKHGERNGSGQAFILSWIKMKFTLISPRIAVQKNDFLGSGVPYWPIELATFASFLKQQKYSVKILDLFGESPESLEDMGDYYLQGKHINNFLLDQEVAASDVFVLYALSYMSHQEVLAISRTIRTLYRDVVIMVLENSQSVTGYDISILAGDFFKHGTDILLCGEVYWNWDEILNIQNNSTGAKIPENVILSTQKFAQTVVRKFNIRPKYPIPDWGSFPIKNYWSLPYSHGPKISKYLPIITSRGCPYSCDFCVTPSTNNTHWRGRIPSDVVNEIIELKEKFGVNDFQIEDLNPTLDKSRWKEICQLLIDHKANIRFYLVSGTKAETIDVVDIPLYAKAGCRYLSISPETGSKRVLSSMGKQFDYKHGIDLIQACKKYGIYTQGCFLVGHPTEEASDHQLSCKYLRQIVKAGLDEVGVFIVSPLAGSNIYKENKINLSSEHLLPSFSPHGREGWEILNKRRVELITLFFYGKLKCGNSLWKQGFRSLFGTPKTKMENLPKRILFIYWIIFKYRIKKRFFSKSIGD